jgi:hypothetical protein
MTHRLDEIKKRGEADRTRVMGPDERHDICCPCTRHFRSWLDECGEDSRWLLAQLEAARKVVEAARSFVGDHGYCSGHCGACGTVKALAEYDAKAEGER